jgi:preprotein translocase subunit SecE
MAIVLKKTVTEDLILNQNLEDAKSLFGKGKVNKNDEKAKKPNWFKNLYNNYYSDIVWPKFAQIINWFFTTIVVCCLLTFVMFYTDNLFKAVFVFIDCSSPVSKNQLIVDGKLTDTCFKDLPKYIINGK